MSKDLRGMFFGSMMRMKKVGSALSGECEIQMNELFILQTVVCECDCAGMNLNVPEIQKRLQISKPAVSYILNSLEKKDYIVRQIDPKDRRKTFITATEKGKEAADISSKQYNEMWGGLIEAFGEQDMEQLIRLLTRLTDLCEKMHFSEE